MVGVPHVTGRQKLYAALVILTSDPDRIEERLEKAYRLAIAPVDVQLDIPPSFTREFLQIRAELQKEYFSPGSSRFANENDRKKWACDIAVRIVAFYDKLARFK